MASTPLIHMPISMIIDLNIGVSLSAGTSSITTVSLSVPPPISLALSHHFSAEGNPI